MTALHRIYPSPADFENLSRLRTEMSAEANAFDYSSVVVNKPWGYEYLWYQNASVAIWMLHLLPRQATSLHCHVRKRTSLIVMDGQVACSTLEDRYRLNVMDAVVLEPGVFHTTQAVSDGGAFVMEVETPPLKGDLVRLKDAFGREGTAYESSTRYSKDTSAYEYRPYDVSAKGATLDFRGLVLRIGPIGPPATLRPLLDGCSLVVACSPDVETRSGRRLDTGAACSGTDFDATDFGAGHPPGELLGIGRLA